MNKTIKCIFLDITTIIVSEIVEVDAELGDPNCKLINPYLLISEEDMKPWTKATNQTEFMIRSEDILTIADPTPEIIEKYLELTA